MKIHLQKQIKLWPMLQKRYANVCIYLALIYITNQVLMKTTTASFYTMEHTLMIEAILELGK